MKKYEKEVLQSFVNDEEAVIKQLESTYNKALNDVIRKSKQLQEHINGLQDVIDNLEDAEEKAKWLSMKQAKVYQKQYQDALMQQINGILDTMHAEEFKTISEYTEKCYEEGWLGAMYSLNQQGIPIIMPIDQEAVIKAVQLDSKISQGLYTRLGEDTKELKKKISAEISRGISTGLSFHQTAQNLKGITNIGYNNAARIARTEGHRVQIQSAMDACYKAKDKGCDIVKQWDSTMDKRTRPSHRIVDGEIRELDERFSNGLLYPADSDGGAGEVVNCRCALLQRAKWAMDEEELETLKQRAEYFGLDKTKNFDDFKQKYLKAVEKVVAVENKPQFIPAKTLKEAVQRVSDALGVENVNLGKMPVELANQYLEGIERFMDDFPMLKGYYSKVGTKLAPNHLGVNKLTGEYIENGTKVKLECELNLKSAKDYNELLKKYELSTKSGHSYKNSSPLSTAIHELVHGIDHATSIKKYGGFNEKGLGVIDRKDWNNITGGISAPIIQQARRELFGKQYGKEVYEGTKYLGSYSLTGHVELLAEAISYEYVSETNPFSARILELFKEEVSKVFK